MQNHTNQEDTISHEEMIQRIDEKRAQRQQDERTVLQTRQDSAYTKESKEGDKGKEP